MSKTVRHRFTVLVEVPAVSGDGWSKYPDYSADEVGRAIRRALHYSCEYIAVVEHADTVPVVKQA